MSLRAAYCHILRPACLRLTPSSFNSKLWPQPQTCVMTASAVKGNRSELKRGAEDVAENVSSNPVEDNPVDEKPKKGGAKKPVQKRQKSTLPNEPTGTKYDKTTMRPAGKPEDKLTVVSWNVAGLRALMKRDAEALKNLAALEEVDVLCIQEHKLQEKHVEELEEQVLGHMEGWGISWSCSTAKAGYSGTAILYRKDAFSEQPSFTQGINLEEHDAEGRVVTMNLPSMYIVNTYVPNSGQGLKRLDYRTQEWDVAFTQYLDGLRKEKPVVVTGDMNCAREPIDIHNARNNLKSAGFTPEERENFQKLYMDAGWVDTFREQHPGIYGYTYFGYRANVNGRVKGWRLDYFLVSSELAKISHDSFILQDFVGSDHVPLGLVLNQKDSS